MSLENCSKKVVMKRAGVYLWPESTFLISAGISKAVNETALK